MSVDSKLITLILSIEAIIGRLPTEDELHDFMHSDRQGREEIIERIKNEG